MTTYTEYDLSTSFSNGATVDWGNKALWSTGTVPADDTTAVVVFQAMTNADGSAKSYNIDIGSCESFSICTLDMAGSELTVAGKLTLQTGVNVISDTAEVIMAGGTINAGDLHLAGTPSVRGIVGTGTISASDYLYNQSSIVSSTTAGANTGGSCWSICGSGGSNNATLTLTGAELVNSGLLEATSGTTLVIDFSTFTNFSSGTLSGGSYEADGGTLELHTTGLITTDAADIVLNGFNCGSIESLNASTGKYVALQSSLTSIAAAGTLDLESSIYITSLSVIDQGNLTVNGSLASFTAASLTVAAGGSVTLDGDTPLLNDVLNVKQLIDNGTITIDAGSCGADIIAASSITGTGTIVIGSKAGLELTGSVANTIHFSDGTGALTLDTPASMAGAITGFTTGDKITLETSSSSGLLNAVLSFFGLGGSSSSITDSYSGTGTAGILTIHEGSSTLKLAFDGNYTASNFSVTSDSHGIEIVGIAHT